MKFGLLIGYEPRVLGFAEYFNSLPSMKNNCIRVSLDSYAESYKSVQDGTWETYFIDFDESLPNVMR